jgi:hypothetical protein
MTDYMDDDDILDDYDGIDEGSDDDRNEYEDERAAKRGTSECDNTCDPQCNWCLVAHACPEDCAGGPCPYESLDPQLAEYRAYDLGQRDAMDGTKRKRFSAHVNRRAYLQGYESWIRKNDRKRARRAARAARVNRSASTFDDMPW